MKKLLKYLIIAFIAGIIISFCVPKGPEWTYIKDEVPNFRTYEIHVDFSKSSCEDRLFIYDVSIDAHLIYSGVCLHGYGGKSTPSKPEFSNEIGSKCSSLGTYTLERIVRMKNGEEAIKLKGWSKTNSNAEERGIYIHSCLMASLLPFNIPGMNFPLTKASEGCFAVSWHTYNAIKYCMNHECENDKTVLIAYE